MTGSRRAISLFVGLWLAVFAYESFRLNYLSPLAGRELPKLKLLFPPGGWIMFYRIEPSEGRAEVYGRKGDSEELIDPHRIFATRWVGYDNIRRNVMVSTLHESRADAFCGYLSRKFPEYQAFAVVEALVPSVLESPQRTLRRLAYRCE